ncbi:MAG: SGNH/GDSL hydrolase family protein [Verrucomicrobiota bacterium]
MNKIIFAMCVLMSVWCSASLADDGKTSASKLKNVILFGDSIRMGYQKEVVKNLKGKAVVWAPEDNCRHSKYLLESLDKWLKGRNPDVIHINCGLHDMFLDKNGKCRHSVDEYADTLRLIFKRLKKTNAHAVVIFALTTAVDEKRQITSKNYGRLVRRNSDVDSYNKKAIEIAKEFDVQINDLNTPIKKAGVENMLVDDGIHLNSKGAREIGALVAEVIDHAGK